MISDAQEYIANQGYSEAEKMLNSMADNIVLKVDFNSDKTITKDELLEAMLDYRREHNKYQVGDLVVHVGDGCLGGVFEVEKLTEKYKRPTRLKQCVGRFGNFPVGRNIIRHLTKEELNQHFKSINNNEF